jgi:hypothetical protein
MKLKSAAFKEGEMIPKEHTCDGHDFSPPLEWSEAPEGVKSYALIVDDPDAPVGIWVHWVLFNIPGNATHLPEHVPHDKILADGSVQGMTDFQRVGYGGPCPPSGTHRYFFKLYALDAKINLPSGITKEELLMAMEEHVLTKAQLMGKYQRQK